MRAMVVCLLAFILAGCTSGQQPALKEIAASPLDPQKVPTQRSLQNPVPLVAARFDASDAGYALRAFRAMGTPTSKIDQSRDVLIRALDAQGNVVSSVSVENPRDVHTVGSTNPARSVLPAATFTVFFQNPDAIRSIEISVAKGPNAGFKQSFRITPAELPSLEAATGKK
jgi:hypothetical protein